VDLVRRRDASAEGGWAYEAHLMVLGSGYNSPATTARRELAAGMERLGGVDGNVSNLAVVSFPRSHSPADGEVASTRVTLSEEEWTRLASERHKERARQRALDRSRRSANPQQYRSSVRQARRAERRAAAGLDERRVTMPTGARLADARGRPRQAYRKDVLSHGHHRLRGRHAEAAAGFQMARTQRGRRLAAEIVSVHGPHLTIEEGNVSVWFRRWGRRCLAFTPGRLINALAQECSASGGGLARVSTARTALSQHCLCGAPVAKTLGQRIHTCPTCGLTGDRDLVSAALAAFTVLDHLGDPPAPGPTTNSLDAPSARSASGCKQPSPGQPCSAPWAPRQHGLVHPSIDEDVPLPGHMPVTASCRPRLGASSRRREVTLATRAPVTDRTYGRVLRWRACPACSGPTR
jgi:hypothetical protein